MYHAACHARLYHVSLEAVSLLKAAADAETFAPRCMLRVHAAGTTAATLFQLERCGNRTGERGGGSETHMTGVAVTCSASSPFPCSPKARAGGTVIFLLSPGHMSTIPMSRPLIIRPMPSTTHWGCPSLSVRLRQTEITRSCRSAGFHSNIDVKSDQTSSIRG